LKKFKNVFAWSYQDMPGIDPEIVEYSIPLFPNSKHIKQKLRRMCYEWTLNIKEEIEK